VKTRIVTHEAVALGVFPYIRGSAARCDSSDKPPRSGATRIAGGGAQRNPRSQAKATKSRVAAPRSRPSSDRDAATRHRPRDLDSGGCAALHPRLFTSCRSAALIGVCRGDEQ
jgi:hypothetical protein